MKYTEDQKKELQKLIAEHDEAYYRHGKPKISDREYDRLKHKFDSLNFSDDSLGLFAENDFLKVIVSVFPLCFSR